MPFVAQGELMKFLVTGNMGYVGPTLVRRLRATYPDATLHGFDNGYFAHCLTGVDDFPERLLDRQYFGDARTITGDFLRGYDAVVLLAAVSNDPMGHQFEAVTHEINHKTAVATAIKAREAGVRSLVYASSCSIYGVADGPARKERDTLSPMTAYAKSKVAAETDLQRIGPGMVVTCLRFATACGMSDRLRLDLVLNDFVAGALTAGELSILSDGTPWRPLIDTQDMARAIDWAISRTATNGGEFLAVNVGSDDRNYQVKDLAAAVVDAIPGTRMRVNASAPVDSRSYRVDFSLFRALAPDHQPQVTLADSIAQLRDGLRRMHFADADYRRSQLIRLQVLERHIAGGRLSPSLRWTSAEEREEEEADAPLYAVAGRR